MQIRVVEDSLRTLEDEIIIYCKQMNPDIEQIRKVLQDLDETIQGTDEGKSCQLKPREILYFEVVDNKTFAYTKDQVWQVQKSLENLEEELAQYGFFRVSKGSLLCLKKVEHFTSTIGSRIIATMENKEQIVISRHYAKLLRAKMKAGKENGHGKV